MQLDREPPSAGRWLSRKEAAIFLTDRGFSISPKTLANYASAKTGPPYRLWLGVKVQYLDGNLLDWALSRVSAP